MYDLIFEVYNISNYDSKAGQGITLNPDPALGLTVGDERPMFISEEEEEYDDDIYIDDADIDAVAQNYIVQFIKQIQKDQLWV